MARFFIAILLAFHVLLCICQDSGFSLGARQLPPRDPPVMTANPLGNDSIGIRRETFLFQDRQLNVSWWYPAGNTSGSSPYISSGGITGKAFKDVRIDASRGPYPLIVLSPGLAARDDAYYFYCQNLASSGYVVVSINHIDATKASVGANLSAYVEAVYYLLTNSSSYTVWLLYSNWFRSTQYALTYRPQEIQFVLDKAIAAATDPSSPFNGAIDTNNIGMTGHSLGGFYSLVKGAGMAIYCDRPLTTAETNTENLILTSVNICAFPEAKKLTSPSSLHDPRIKAVIALAPPFFLKPEEISRAAAAIKTPIMILSGNDPRYESTLAPQRQAYDAAQGAKYIVEVSATDHLLVSESYQFNNETGSMVPAEDKANFEEKAKVYMTYSAAFFDVYLKGNIGKKEVLHGNSSSYVARLQYSD